MSDFYRKEDTERFSQRVDRIDEIDRTEASAAGKPLNL